MMVTNLRGSYEERLATLGMKTLETRRLRGDLIETYKILSGKSDFIVQTWFNLAQDNEYAVRNRATTGHLNLVQPPIPNQDPRKNFSSQRVVSHWNQLPNHVKMV
jgi:ribonuclease P/MRP protein subunit RPP40